MAINQTISIGRGEDIELKFTMTPRVDITGWLIQFTVTSQLNNSPKVAQLNAVLTNAPLGKFSIYLSANQTYIIFPDVYQYDVWRIDAGQERILSIGKFEVTANSRVPF
jgi:hypothetical protein